MLKLILCASLLFSSVQSRAQVFVGVTAGAAVLTLAGVGVSVLTMISAISNANVEAIEIAQLEDEAVDFLALGEMGEKLEETIAKIRAEASVEGVSDEELTLRLLGSLKELKNGNLN